MPEWWEALDEELEWETVIKGGQRRGDASTRRLRCTQRSIEIQITLLTGKNGEPHMAKCLIGRDGPLNVKPMLSMRTQGFLRDNRGPLRVAWWHFLYQCQPIALHRTVNVLRYRGSPQFCKPILSSASSR